MKARDWQRMVKTSVLPEFPDLELSRSLVHYRDTQWLLRGLAKDSSGLSDDFAVWVFVQPLYVPANHVWFTYGHRLRRVGTSGSGAWWAPASWDPASELVASIHDQAMPYLSGLRTPADLLRLAQSRLKGRSAHDRNILADIAYSAVLAGEDRVVKQVGRTMSTLDPGLPDTWEARKTAEISGLLSLWSDDPSAARQQLQDWRDQTAQSLGID